MVVGRLEGRRPELAGRTVGVADMRAAVMPERFEQALEAVSRYVAHRDDRADRDTYEHLTRLRSQVVGWSEWLSGATVSASLDRNDLHANNILGTGSGQVRFYDWGDSVVAHPFSSLLVALGAVCRTLGVRPDDPAIKRPLEAYLEVFGRPGELLAEVQPACRLAKIARALTWQRALHGHSFAAVGEYADGPLRTLAALRSDPWSDLG
jgi:hypothetical protein